MNHETESYNPLSEIQRMIDDAPEAIAAEYERTTNPWWACVVSVIAVLQGHLEIGKTQGIFSGEEFQRFMSKINILQQQVDAIKLQYPTHATTPPEAVRQQVLEEIEHFLE